MSETLRATAETDPEITAMRTITETFASLTIPERARVLSRLMIRYSVSDRPLGTDTTEEQ